MAALFNVPIRRQQIILFVVDLGLLMLSLMLAFAIARFAKFNIFIVLDRFTAGCLVYLGVYSLVFFVGQLYEVEYRYKEMRSFLYTSALVLVATIVISMVFFMVPEWRIARRVIVLQAPLAALFIYAWRRGYLFVCGQLMPPRRVLVVGANETVVSLIEDLKAKYAREYEITGIVDDDPGKEGHDLGGIPIVGGASSLKRRVRNGKIDTIVFSPGYRLAVNGGTVRSVLELKARGVKVYELVTFYKRVTGKVPVKYIEDQWLLFSQDFAGTARADARNFKRLMDILVATVCLTLLSPLMLVLALLVKLTSRGPILYRQQRVGLDKRTYKLLKFRTMKVNAEQDGAPVWASPNDERVTSLGLIMRRLRLDEIPQFINVLRGEMSVIGPRPERPYFVERLEKTIPYYALRFAAKPGLTGWAQVNYRYGASEEDAHTKLQYDLYYIQEMSPLLDVVIMLKTFQTLLFRPGY
ncbi:MAG: sugar transferase [Acidobacteriota bacterium]